MSLSIEIEVQGCESSDINVTNHRETLTLEITDAPVSPSGLIDDDAGLGDTYVTWSADKSSRELADKVDKVAGYSLVDDDEIAKLLTVEQDAQKNTVISVAGRQGDVLLDKSDVGLSAVDNTADADKPVSTAVAAALDDIDALIDKNSEDIGDLSQLPLPGLNSLVDVINMLINDFGVAFVDIIELIPPIDDAAGVGNTNATWSADKSSREIGELSALIGDVESVLVAINGEP